jgi:hypothetical protein
MTVVLPVIWILPLGKYLKSLAGLPVASSPDGVSVAEALAFTV